MKARYKSEEKYNSRKRWALARLAVTALRFAAIILCLSFALKSVVLAAEPLVLNYSTISVTDAFAQPGTTIFTVEIELTNMDTVAYSNVSVVAISLTYGSSYGSVAVGNLASGEIQTFTGQFNIPTQSIGDITFLINHS